MRGVAIGFIVHSVTQLVTIANRALAARDLRALTALGDCLDEAWYSWLIWTASSHYAAISTSTGADLENLMFGIGEMRRLWRKMQKPLFVKSTIMVLHLLWQFHPTKALVRGTLRTIGLRRGGGAAAASEITMQEVGYLASASAAAWALLDNALAPIFGEVV